jgi:hypothetical protein
LFRWSSVKGDGVSDIDQAELMAAIGNGQVLDCAVESTRRVIAADLIRSCCLGLKDQVDPRGIRLTRAKVSGRLDLAGLDVPFPVWFDDCEFDAAPSVEGSSLYALGFRNCPLLPGLLANGVRIRHDLDLSGSRVGAALATPASTSKKSAIWLCEAEIGGRLLCVNTDIRSDGERSIQADRLHVGGTVRLIHRFSAQGEIRLLGAQIDGSLDLTGARLSSPITGLALDLGDATVGGSLFLIPDPSGRTPVIKGRVDLGSARIGGQFLMRRTEITEARTLPTRSGYARTRVSGTAVSAPGLAVGAEFVLEGTCRVSGGIDLARSDLNSLDIGEGCLLQAPGCIAVDLSNASLRSHLILDPGAAVQGTLRLVGARIRGNLSLRGVTLSRPKGRSLVEAQGVAVEGDVNLRDLRATGGQLGFRAATLGSVVDAGGAILDNPHECTLNLHQTTVGGSVRLAEGFTSNGVVILNRAIIEGRLLCMGGTFNCPAASERNEEGHALQAISMTVRGGMDLGWTSVSPSLDLTDATTTFLADNPANWPPQFRISGFTYERLAQPQGNVPIDVWDADARCVWLARQVLYDAGPYEQAASVFRQHGYGREAERILMAQGRHARRTITGRGATRRRALDLTFSATVGYGYRPARVLWLLAILLAAVTLSLELPAAQATLRAAGPDNVVLTTTGTSAEANTSSTPSAQTPLEGGGCAGGQVRCFNPLFYAMDTVIPLVSLNQRSVWYPDARAKGGLLMEWWLNVAALLGWLLSTIFVLSLARLARIR